MALLGKAPKAAVEEHRRIRADSKRIQSLMREFGGAKAVDRVEGRPLVHQHGSLGWRISTRTHQIDCSNTSGSVTFAILRSASQARSASWWSDPVEAPSK